MKYWKQLLIIAVVVAGIGMAILPVEGVSAINVTKDTCTANGASVICEAAKTDNATSMTTNIITTMLYILGILAVIMIIFGGIRYVLSAGDASKVKTAKDTIMYSVIGLIVAVLAYAIVNFVVTRI